jgi:Uma2 family endonuclease
MATPAPPRALPTYPTLDAGDHLTPEEFRRRYEQRHDLKKAELIFGVVYVPSPARLPQHAEPHGLLVGELANYRRRTRGVSLGDNATVRFEDGSEVQPDGLLRYLRARGGATRLVEGYIHGPPELAAEVAASSAAYDLHEKMELYRRTGVQEYIVWRTGNEAIDWWQLVNGEYVPIEADERGVILSVVFPGLELDVPVLLAAAREAWEADE